MKRQRRFVVGAVALLGVVGYLMVTGMQDSMTYFLTPGELAARMASDPSTRDLGIRLGGRVVPGTVRFDQKTLDLRFQVMDIPTGTQRYTVHYNGPVPDTFQEGRDVVAEGRLGADGTFEATNVLTKCGSRYEAAEGELKR